MASAAYIRERLLDSIRVDVGEETIQDILDNNKYLVILAPEGSDLWTSPKNDFRVAASLDEARRFTKGYNWDTARVASALVLSGGRHNLKCGEP